MGKSDLILLHGALGSSVQFNELKLELSGSFHVHTFNFSGHGGSEIPEQGYSIDLFEEDVLSLMKREQIPSAHFFGYSMGGYVALSLAGKKPEIVQSVFTLATKFDWNPTTAQKESGMLNPEIILQKVPAFAAKIEMIHAPTNWKKIMEETAAMMIQLGENPLGETDFSKISCRVKLAVGDSDKMVSREETFNVAKMIPGAETLVLLNTPHPLEACDLKMLSKEIIAFCQ